MDAGPAEWGRPLHERVLDAVGARPGAALLDVGCGTGQLLRMAADRGVRVAGVDADPAQLALAAALVPSAALLRADLHALPQPTGSAPALTCVQVLMHVANPLAALREIARVAAPGASVALTVWGPPELCAIGVFGEVLGPLLSMAVPGTAGVGAARPRPRPPALSADGRLATLATLAGLRVDAAEEVRCPFDYPDQGTMLDSVFASELGRRAQVRAGAKSVRRAVLAGLAPYRRPDGGYRLDNTFRLVVGTAGATAP